MYIALTKCIREEYIEGVQKIEQFLALVPIGASSLKMLPCVVDQFFNDHLVNSAQKHPNTPNIDAF